MRVLDEMRVSSTIREFYLFFLFFLADFAEAGTRRPQSDLPCRGGRFFHHFSRKRKGCTPDAIGQGRHLRQAPEDKSVFEYFLNIKLLLLLSC